MRSRRTLWLLAVSLAGVAVFVYLIFVGWVMFKAPAENYAHRMPFDAAVWRNPPEDDDLWWPMRLRMSDDLMERRLLDGLTSKEVRALLGPPTVTKKFQNWHLVYELGPERGLFRIDSEWLAILFDGDFKVARYEIVRD